jgi:hypothetical protein
MVEFDKPLSRTEAILQNALGAENEVVPQSRVEELLQRLDEALENGGGGGGSSSGSNVDTIIKDNKIQFFSKGGN